VCCALFLLSVVYAVGARTVASQTGHVEAGYIETGGENTTAVINRLVYFWHGPAQGISLVTSYPIPGNSRIVFCVALFNEAWALLENGEMWRSVDGGAWTLRVTFPGSTPTTSESFGSVKARYR
jgi:hypothetical protein